jgi:fatty-acyl-CoA synthase
MDSVEPLTPARLLERSATIFAERTAIIDGDLRFTYRAFATRTGALVGGLLAGGIAPGDRVAALCANSHVMLELHHAVPRSGAVLVPLNTRLTNAELAWILEHCGARLLVVTSEHAELGVRLGEQLGIQVLAADGPDSDYERLVAGGESVDVPLPAERSLLSINYTSGTTGRPKGVMYHHRGAYLQALAMAYHVGLGPGSEYLWTLPMFHCHGWCFPWAVTAAGGTHVCLRTVDLDEVWRSLRAGATHFSAAPTVLTMIAEHPDARGPRLEHTVRVSTGGAPPSPTLLRRMADLNLEVTHLYGLTETFGPVMVNVWQPEWDELPRDEIDQLKARQGTPNITASMPRVVDAADADLPADGASVGELVIRGNGVMLGYYRDDAATVAADLDGWFRTGDLAVMHPDGYVEIRDRLKDVIISGGENIASVEVERVLDSHPDVIQSAVVGRPDPFWGEVPVAFVTVRPGAVASAEELTAFARTRLAGFKVPKQFVFGELPRTSTGKIRKNTLREQAVDTTTGLAEPPADC